MMAKIAVLVGIISMIMMQSVSGAPKINYNQDHVENVTEKRTELAYTTTGKLKVIKRVLQLLWQTLMVGRPVIVIHTWKLPQQM